MADRDSFEQHPYALPPGATEVVLVRHGASAPPVEGVMNPLVDGHSNPALAEAGRRQAASVAARLATEPVKRLFVTNLRRTHETAEPLAAAIDLEPEVIADLREVFLGEFEGGEYRVRAARQDPIIQQVFAEQRWDAIPGAESLDALGSRVRRGIDQIVAATGPDATAVAIVHGAVIGELCHLATESKPFAFVHADFVSISRLVVMPDGSWLLRSFNDISHLSVTTGPSG